MSDKKDHRILFDLELDWTTGKRGILSTVDAEETIHVSTPPEFGGEGRYWTPEHLFLGSISSCFMSTFLAFAEKLKFEVSAFNCPVIGQLAIKDGKYAFIAIDLFPKVTLADRSLKQQATLALEKTHKYCIITNAVSAPVFYHSEIVVEEPSVVNMM